MDQMTTRVIAAMYERFGDELTVDDLARTAMYSKFHFSRMFRRATGVSPGRFLSAVRFQEAKRLLVETSLSVAEISNRVGYSSLGTFSTRFKKFVGMSPTEYRRRGGRPSSTRPANGARAAGALTARVHGRVRAASTRDHGQIFVGLFRDSLPHGSPVAYTVQGRPGDYVLEDVPEGTWYLLAHGVPGNRDGAGAGPDLVGRLGPIAVSGATVSAPDLQLRPMRIVDLPVLATPFAGHPGAAGSGPARRRLS